MGLEGGTGQEPERPGVQNDFITLTSDVDCVCGEFKDHNELKTFFLYWQVYRP